MCSRRGLLLAAPQVPYVLRMRREPIRQSIFKISFEKRPGHDTVLLLWRSRKGQRFPAGYLTWSRKNLRRYSLHEAALSSKTYLIRSMSASRLGTQRAAARKCFVFAPTKSSKTSFRAGWSKKMSKSIRASPNNSRLYKQPLPRSHPRSQSRCNFGGKANQHSPSALSSESQATTLQSLRHG